MRVRLSQSKVGRWVAPEPLTVKLNLKALGPDVVLRSHTTDISVLKEILVGDSYAPIPVDGDVATVVDLGANIGLSHRWLRTRYPNARFLCVEPDPGNLAILRRNVRAVDRAAIIEGVCVGAFARRVHLEAGHGEWSYRMSESDDPEGIEVKTMDELLARAGFGEIGVLKCDIEGAEAEIFADCSSWIGRVGVMSVECHLDRMVAGALLDSIEANGGRFEVAHHEANPHLGFDIVTLRRAA